jgi:L-asparaginase II
LPQVRTRANPVLVEVRRGDAIESAHRGAVAIVNSGGAVVYSLGDIERAGFPRSAVKNGPSAAASRDRRG